MTMSRSEILQHTIWTWKKLLQSLLWVWKQPLTKRPLSPSAAVSDLFVWRSNDDWQTFFELTDIPSLFEDDCNSRYVTFVFYNKAGEQIVEQRMALQAHKRKTLNVSAIIGRSNGELGTFAVFHEATPRNIRGTDSYLAERGYVSYRYRNAPLRVYVHGNLDAISKSEDGEMQLLGGMSFLRREYHLQHKIEPGIVYEFGLVNPCSQRQKCLCKLISASSEREVGLSEIELDPGGTQLFSMQVKDSSGARLIILSRMIMARPIVFRIDDHKVDVFHG